MNLELLLFEKYPTTSIQNLSIVVTTYFERGKIAKIEKIISVLFSISKSFKGYSVRFCGLSCAKKNEIN
jgi:hypothetical protein